MDGWASAQVDGPFSQIWLSRFFLEIEIWKNMVKCGYVKILMEDPARYCICSLRCMSFS
jgi:hypothetical protein